MKNLIKVTALTLFASTLFIVSCSSSKNTTSEVLEISCIDSTKINPTAMCTMDYTPVCGCDGKTYGNACAAEKSGVTSYTKGKCNE